MITLLVQPSAVTAGFSPAAVRAHAPAFDSCEDYSAAEVRVH